MNTKIHIKPLKLGKLNSGKSNAVSVSAAMDKVGPMKVKSVYK